MRLGEKNQPSLLLHGQLNPNVQPPEAGFQLQRHSDLWEPAPAISFFMFRSPLLISLLIQWERQALSKADGKIKLNDYQLEIEVEEKIKQSSHMNLSNLHLLNY